MKKYSTYKDTGWALLPQIPAHWELRKLKFVSAIYNGDSLNDDQKQQYESDDMEALAYISSKDIDAETNKIEYINGLRIPKDNKQFKLAPRSSALLCIEGGSAGRKLGFTDQEVYFVNKLACFKAKDIRAAKFLFYALQSNVFGIQFRNAIKGMIGGVSIADLKNFYLPLPTPEEQMNISSYLDKQVFNITSLIQKKTRVIQLLTEQRQALINEAITKGLRPAVKMKDSGIKWMGSIPSHWDIVRIGHYAQIVRGASPRPAGDPRYFGGDFMPWITVGEVTNGNEKYLTSTKNYLTKEGSQLSRIIYAETLLLSNSGATLGIPKISMITGCINDGSVAFLKFKDKLERDFLYYFFITHTMIYRSEMSGYGQPNLNTDIIKDTRIPLPPLAEQKAIINYIESKMEKFDNLLKIHQLQIEKLKEFRQSVISEGIVGRIDVRN